MVLTLCQLIYMAIYRKLKTLHTINKWSDFSSLNGKVRAEKETNEINESSSNWLNSLTEQYDGKWREGTTLEKSMEMNNKTNEQ